MIGGDRKQMLQETIRPSADLRNLLEILAEAEDDAAHGRVAPIKETFDDLRDYFIDSGKPRD